MENLSLVRKLQMVYFFTVGRNLAVIFSVHRMIVVILKLPLLCGEIRALLNQNVMNTRSNLVLRVLLGTKVPWWIVVTWFRYCPDFGQ